MVLADIGGPGKITYFYYTDDSNGHASDGPAPCIPRPGLEVLWMMRRNRVSECALVPSLALSTGRRLDYQSLPMQITIMCLRKLSALPFSRRARLRAGPMTGRSVFTFRGLRSSMS